MDVWNTDQRCMDVRYGTLISVVWMWGMEHWSVVCGCEVWNTNQWCVDVRYGTLISDVKYEHWSLSCVSPFAAFLPSLFFLPFLFVSFLSYFFFYFRFAFLRFIFLPVSLFHIIYLSTDLYIYVLEIDGYCVVLGKVWCVCVQTSCQFSFRETDWQRENERDQYI